MTSLKVSPNRRTFCLRVEVSRGVIEGVMVIQLVGKRVSLRLSLMRAK